MNCLPSDSFRRIARLSGAVLLALACIFPANRGLAADSDPEVVVGAFHDALLAVMKEPESVGVQGRYDKLSGPVDAAFDLERMIRISTGSYWAEATGEQRKQLVDAFRRLSTATYATRFHDYSGEKFETIGQRPGPQKTILVATRIVESNGKSHELTYVLKEADSRWRIVDVLLENISQLAVQISEYRRTLKDSGIDGLIATLNQKADDLLNK